MPSLTQARVFELDKRLSGLTAGSGAVWGVMTAHQMVGHLRDSMRGASCGIPLKSQASPLRNPVARFMALRSGFPWPRNMQTVPELDLRGQPKPDAAGFAADLAALRRELSAFEALEASRLSPQHPVFGPMTREQWMCWAYLHADHHLRQFGC